MFAPALEPYRGSGADWILDAYLAELVDVRPRFAEAEVLVAEHDERIVGTIAFYADVRHQGWSNLPAGWAGFRALAVAPRLRGAGIGKALVQHCIERTRKLGAETLGIHTISLLTDAVRLYQRLGFLRCPEFDLRAADIYPSEHADEMVGLAFRLNVEPATPPRALNSGDPSGPRPIVPTVDRGWSTLVSMACARSGDQAPPARMPAKGVGNGVRTDPASGRSRWSADRCRRRGVSDACQIRRGGGCSGVRRTSGISRVVRSW